MVEATYRTLGNTGGVLDTVKAGINSWFGGGAPTTTTVPAPTVVNNYIQPEWSRLWEESRMVGSTGPINSISADLANGTGGTLQDLTGTIKNVLEIAKPGASILSALLNRSKRASVGDAVYTVPPYQNIPQGASLVLEQKDIDYLKMQLGAVDALPSTSGISQKLGMSETMKWGLLIMGGAAVLFLVWRSIK